MNYSTTYSSPLGPISIASDGDNITGLWFAHQKYFAAGLKGEVEENHDLIVFAMARKWLDGYFAGKKPSILRLPLAPAGSSFRKGVWDILCEIPYGQCLTYGDIAKKMAVKMDKPNMSSQAVGGAVGHNLISLIIPCHRVIGTNGSLTGYAGGIDRKVKLLELEGVDTSKLFLPRKGTAL